MFGTSGIRGPVGDEVTAETALAVGRALPTLGYDRVVVGRDPRESGQMLKRALIAGITECGGDVIDVGMAATPTIARSVRIHDADAGVAITASHNPAPDNGFKLWTPSGQAFDTAQREEVTEIIESESYQSTAWDAVGSVTASETANVDHVSALTDAVDLEEDVSVVVDVGNGAGGVTADALAELGCSVETLNAQPDGSFPARPSEPTAEHCQTLQEVVAATDADLGIAHDGDADRMLTVDENGRWISGDVLLAMFASAVAGDGDKIAAPVDTSLAVDDAVAAHGATVERTQVGDVYVAERAREDDVLFGGEPSGAWIWPEETLCPDGPLAACRLVELVASVGPLSALVDSIETYPIERESFSTEVKAAVMDTLSELVAERYDANNVDTLDGVRIAVEEGWMLIRASGTQPLIRITAEARTEETADTLHSEALWLVETAQSSV